jgi:hypothetical protein
MNSTLKSCLLHACGAAVILASQPLAAQTAPAQRSLAPQAQASGPSRSAQADQQLIACAAGQSPQGRKACVEEARAARAAARQGKLHKPGEDYAANALARCQPLTGEYRAACQARVMGLGQASGSVAGGGILRWVETVVVEPEDGPVTISPKTDEAVILVPIQG